MDNEFYKSMFEKQIRESIQEKNELHKYFYKKEYEKLCERNAKQRVVIAAHLYELGVKKREVSKLLGISAPMVDHAFFSLLRRYIAAGGKRAEAIKKISSET